MIKDDEAWEKHKKDDDVMPFCSMRGEVYLAEGVILRFNKIIVPKRIQQKVF